MPQKFDISSEIDMIIKNVPYDLEKAPMTQKREYLEELKTHFTIMEFQLIKEGEIDVESHI